MDMCQLGADWAQLVGFARHFGDGDASVVLVS